MSDTPQHTIRITGIEPLTPDVRRYRCTKPQGFSFDPGQATMASVDKDGWREETRPFTFTSLPEEDALEFTIKSYPDHDGVTEQIGFLQEGDALNVGDAWGAITDAGPGLFIAGGAGVTPFIAILRRRQRDGELDGCHLLFSNATEADIILRDEFEAMEGLRTTWVVTDQPSSEFAADRIDEAMLKDVLDGDTDQQFYVCGPPPMVDDITASLKSIGVDEDRITVEESS